MYVMAVAGPEVVLDVSERDAPRACQELPLFGVDRLARLLGVLGDVAGRAEDVHEPAAYLRDRADAHGAPRCRCDAGGSGRACGNPGAPAGRRLCRGCRARCACGSGPRRGRPWSPVRRAPQHGSDSAPLRHAPCCGPSACVGDLGCHAPTGANPAAAARRDRAPRGRPWSPSAPAGSAPRDSPSVPLAEGGPLLPAEGVAPTATPVAVARPRLRHLPRLPRRPLRRPRALCRRRSPPPSRTWRRCSASGPVSSPR